MRNLIEINNHQGKVLNEPEDITQIFLSEGDINILKKGELLYRSGKPARNVYLILEGRIRMMTYNMGIPAVKAIYSEQDFFGELCVLEDIDTWTDFAQAVDNKTVIASIPKETMKTALQRSNTIQKYFFKVLAKRINKMEFMVNSLVHHDARTRIIEFLKDLANEKGQKIGYEVMIKSHLKHKDIADLTGTSRQTVTTILNNLRDTNIISFDRRRILIRDLENLR